MYDINYLKNNIDLFNEIICFKEIDSTNIEGLKNKYQHNTLLLANYQSRGKGQYNRVFNSYKNCGIYMSIVLCDNLNNNSNEMLVMISSLSIKKAFKNLYNIDLELKWINDLMYHDLKVAGILCERVYVGNSISKVVVGIGINLIKPTCGYENLLATSIFQDKDCFNINEIVVEIIKCFEYYYQSNQNDILNEYKDNLNIINKWTTYKKKDKEIKVKVIDVLEDARLLVLIDGEYQVIDKLDIIY